jgi:DNA-binding XRE family transcriptional regulator
MKLNSIKLRQFREKARMSQNELGMQIGLSQATIWFWEQRDTDIKLEYGILLCEILGIPLVELSDDEIINAVDEKKSKKSENLIENPLEIYHLQNDLIFQLKKQVTSLELEVLRLKKKIEVRSK